MGLSCPTVCCTRRPISTHELHVTMDEHLAEDLTLDGVLAPPMRFTPAERKTIPKTDMKIGNFWWIHSTSPPTRTPTSSARMPDRPSLPTNLLETVEAKWIIYGDFLGDQKCSILRLILAPGAKTQFCPESPALFHTNGGSGRVENSKCAITRT